MIIDDALQVTTMESGDEGLTRKKGQEGTLTPVGMEEVSLLPEWVFADSKPSTDVVDGVCLTVEVEDVDDESLIAKCLNVLDEEGHVGGMGFSGPFGGEEENFKLIAHSS